MTLYLHNIFIRKYFRIQKLDLKRPPIRYEQLVPAFGRYSRFVYISLCIYHPVTDKITSVLK